MAKDSTAAVAAVIKELKSGYGDTTSSIAPFKEIMGVSLVMSKYDPEVGDMWARIDVNAYQQSPYGDNAETRKSFTVTRADMRKLAEAAPDFKTSFNDMADTLDAEFPEAHALHKAERAEIARTTRTLGRSVKRVKSICFN